MKSYFYNENMHNSRITGASEQLAPSLIRKNQLSSLWAIRERLRQLAHIKK